MVRQRAAPTPESASSEQRALRELIVRLARSAEALGLVMHTQGNLSCRIPDTDLVLITPTRIPCSELQPDDLVTLDLGGRKVQGRHPPSSESSTHLHAYRPRQWAGG